MFLRIAAEFDLREVPDANQQGDPSSEILRDGKATGKRVAGAQLAAAVAWRDHVVLFALDGFIFEEFLHVHLLDAQLDVVDSGTRTKEDNAGAAGVA
ncbi:MAG: hypothetical protein JWP29_820 [Rhodoferax sp.]|nr:hypothetical protein [Rhodoferax sp.]